MAENTKEISTLTYDKPPRGEEIDVPMGNIIAPMSILPKSEMVSEEEAVIQLGDAYVVNGLDTDIVANGIIRNTSVISRVSEENKKIVKGIEQKSSELIQDQKDVNARNDIMDIAFGDE